MPKMLNFVLKNIFSKPATRLYPIQTREPFERFRGRIVCDDTNCIYCMICQRKCPADAIVVDRANKTWELDALRCIICGECANVCPKKCITMNNERRMATGEKERVVLKKE